MSESTHCHYSRSGCSNSNSSIQLLGRQKSRRMKRAQKVISILFKAMNYGQNQGENFDNITGQVEEDEEFRRPPSAPSQRKPPIIRIRRERSLNGVVWGSPQQLTTTSDSANTTLENTTSRKSRKRQNHQSKSKKHDSDENYNRSPSRHQSHDQLLVGHEPSIIPNNNNNNNDNHFHSSHPHLNSGNHLKVDEQSRHHRRRNLSGSSMHNINNNSSDNNNKDDRNNNHHSENPGTTSTSYSPEAERFVKAAIDKSRPVERQVIRIINGNEPSIQSQVLLNTKTSQPWDDLVRDLGMAVKLTKKRKSHMETISGRRIQSYSQLRSELLAGTHAFYIYSDREDISELGTLNETFTLIPGQSTRSRKTDRQDNYYLGTQPQLSQSYNPLPTVNYNNINIQNQIHKASSSILVPGHSKTQQIIQHGSHENIRKSSIKIPTGSSTNLNTKSSIAVKRTSSTNRLQTSSSNTVNSSSKSNPNLLSANYNHATTTTTAKQPRHRSTRRRRSEASVYLVSASRSRSLSPD